jgi:hypothetical protein
MPTGTREIRRAVDGDPGVAMSHCPYWRFLPDLAVDPWGRRPLCQMGQMFSSLRGLRKRPLAIERLFGWLCGRRRPRCDNQLVNEQLQLLLRSTAG